MKVLVKYLGYILIISSFFRIIPIITALIYGENPTLFIVTFFISLLLGLAFIKLDGMIKSNDTILDLKKALMIVAISFIILPLISAITFLPSFNYNFLDALFESISGFTTTGLTLYSAVEDLPRSLLIWRAETQWMGGIGIIMVFLFIFSRLRIHTHDSEPGESVSLYQAQGFSERLEPNLRKSIRDILLIYSFYTILGIMLLYVTGMSFFESISMSFTSISTGGFIVKNQLLLNDAQFFVLCLLMIIGAISFIAHNNILRLKLKEFLSGFEKNVFLIMIATFIFISMIVLNFKEAAFQIISAMTTTGYALTPIATLPQLVILITMISMVIGGNTASTSGGIKTFRLVYIFKSIPWLVRKLMSPPHAVLPFKVGKKPVDEENIFIVYIFVAAYVLLLIVSTIIFMLFGYGFLDSSFQVFSALGTVGLQTINLIELNWICKTVLILLMLLGRLEIFPLFVLARNMFLNFVVKK